MNLKILHIIASVDPASGGTIEALLRQEEFTRPDRLDGVREIVTLDPPGSPWIAAIPLTVHAMGDDTDRASSWLRPGARYRYSPALIPWLKANVARFDTVIVHGLWNYASWAASRVLPRAGVPYFVFTHGMLDPWFRRRHPLKHAVKQVSWLIGEGRLLANAQAVLFTCEEERRQARQTFFGHAYSEHVVGFGAAPPEHEADLVDVVLPSVMSAPSAPYLLFLSRIHHKKGCDLLIEGFAAVAAERPDLQLVIAGPDPSGWEPALRNLAQRHGISEKVHFPGGLFGSAKWKALHQAEAFVLPSHQENFGIIVAEALACGTPVLISDKVNIWREIAEAGAGLVAPDTVAGTETMLRAWFATSAAERAAMAGAAVRLFERQFNVKHTAPQLLRTLSRLMADDRGDRAAM